MHGMRPGPLGGDFFLRRMRMGHNADNVYQVRLSEGFCPIPDHPQLAAELCATCEVCWRMYSDGWIWAFIADADAKAQQVTPGEWLNLFDGAALLRRMVEKVRDVNGHRWPDAD